MKIKINECLKGVDGVSPIVEKEIVLTLKEVCIAAVLTPMEGEDQKKKFEKWEIYKKLRDSVETVELSVEEISAIKASIGKFYPPLILGQSFEMLEQII
jgi:hypothetical protein